MPLSRSVAGKVALITGAASGIGLATARLFAEQGAQVALTDVRDDGLASLADSLQKDAGSAKKASVRSWTLDVADLDAVDSVIPEIAAHFGGLDVLVNNAGIALPIALDDPDYEQAWEKSLAVLLSAHQRTVRAALPFLRQSQCARVVNVASVEGLGATRLRTPYSAAKSGVIGLTRALAVDLGPEGITVNCVCPGPIHTGMTAPIADEYKERFARRFVALKRYGEPEEVAHAILSLSLPAAAYITGVALPVDGGMTARNA